ncbi:MAG TPA: M28 family peptidase [Gemmatimonadaceae bacterium]|nr:M28 family peptidase [Gemmatimonadaceae bacterium]
MRRLGALLMITALAACGRERGPRTQFSGETALGYVKTQLDFGPRIPGSEGHRRTGDWIVAQMRQRADTVIEQRWTHVTMSGDTLPMRNILARYKPKATERVLYVTHWDTRPISDGAKDSAQRALPVPGANDGASGVALFMALGDVLRQTPPDVGLDLLFVDGEDYGEFPQDADLDAAKDVLIGSRYFAKHLPEEGYMPLYGVLWDMIGDRDLQIYQEGNSLRGAPEVVSLVWHKADDDLHYSKYFIPQPGQFIIDDHIPLLNAGLHVIDVIDYDYPYHHTPEDTFDKVSAASLQIVGDVALSLVSGGR